MLATHSGVLEVLGLIWLSLLEKVTFCSAVDVHGILGSLDCIMCTVPLHSGFGEVRVLILVLESEVVTFSFSMIVIIPFGCFISMLCGALDVLGLSSLSEIVAG